MSCSTKRHDVLHHLCCESCTTICYDYSWRTMREDDVVDEEVRNVTGSSSLKGSSFTVSHQIISRNHDPAVASRRLREWSGQVHADGRARTAFKWLC